MCIVNDSSTYVSVGLLSEKNINILRADYGKFELVALF